jgi:hypothetical protein
MVKKTSTNINTNYPFMDDSNPTLFFHLPPTFQTPAASRYPHADASLGDCRLELED